MNVLTIFVGSIEAGDERDVIQMLGQGLHGRCQFQRIDSWLMLDTSFIFDLVGIESTNKIRQICVFFPREKATPNNAIRHVDDDQFFS